MKKLYFLVIFLINYSANAQTNVYHEFPDSNAVWNFHMTAYCFWNGNADEYYSISISGDTVINNITYHNLTTPYVESYSTGVCGPANTGNGSIREDVAARKVYFVAAGETTEYLLYDFNLQVGDSVPGYTQRFGRYDVVQVIDSVLVGNEYRKRWKVNTCYNISIIEGIGWSYGINVQSPGCNTDLADYSLTCFSQNGQTLYPSTVNNCQLITSVAAVDSKRTLHIYPNPSKGMSSVELTNGTISEIQVFDISGLLVTTLEPGGSQIDLNHLAFGTYLIKVVDDKQHVYLRKMVRM